MPGLINKNVLMDHINEVFPVFDDLRKAAVSVGCVDANELRDAFGKMCIYNDTHPSTNDCINITDRTEPLDFSCSPTITTTTYPITTGPVVTKVTSERSIEEIVKEKIEEYREIMKLQALGCKNCGGSIDKETMICEYCGTNYRN